MEIVRTLLEQQPMVALFLTIAIGYLVGAINIKGFSLGVGAVLFVALAVGWFAPKSVPAAAVGTLGLALFLYAVGIQYGKEFFRGLASAEGRKANLLALIGVLLAGAVTPRVRGRGRQARLRPWTLRGVRDEHPDAAGGHPDAGQRRPRGRLLGRLSVRRRRADPASCTLAFLILKPRIEVPAGAGQELLEIAIRNPELSRQAARRSDDDLARGRADRRGAQGRSQQARVPGGRPRRGRRGARRRFEQGAARTDAATARRGGDRPDHQRSPRPGLSPRLRVPARVGRQAARRSRTPRRHPVPGHARPPRRHRLARAARPRARVRRPRRPLDRSRELPRGAQVLRRFHQRHRRVQLHLHRARPGARLPGRGDPRADPRRREARHRPRGRARGGARPRQAASHRAA